MAPKRRHVSSRVGIIAKIRKNRNFDGKKRKTGDLLISV